MRRPSLLHDPASKALQDPLLLPTSKRGEGEGEDASPLSCRYLIIAFVVEGEAARRRGERELVTAFLANWSPPLLRVVYSLDEGGMARERDKGETERVRLERKWKKAADHIFLPILETSIHIMS
nr:hypothetical protein Itr_chr05CG11270 [Ipomoea trifida]